jgi:transposase
MSNNTLNSLRKQLTFDFMLDFTVELTYEEVALLTLFENLDYSGFGTRLGRKEKIEPFRMMLLLIHGAMNNRTSSRDLERHVERDLFMKAVFGTDVHVDHSTISRFIARYPEQIEDIFRQSVERLSSLGELGKKVVFQDGTKVESRAGRYTFVWKSYAEKNREKCLARIRKLLEEAVASGLVHVFGQVKKDKMIVRFPYFGFHQNRSQFSISFLSPFPWKSLPPGPSSGNAQVSSLSSRYL